MTKPVPEKRTVSENRLQNNRIVEYLRETWFELRKVSWPTRSEAVNLTIIVAAVTTFLALVLGLLDYIFQTAFALLLRG
ncbi:MAG: preprotein translocase subunit SecE [Anaerolineaceae bacterium]|nr:preprotein translocase subunit SecE [Anaerolineae bacterium]MDX9831726.1 preprotein translocase subunit SecE [Anaerolineae bacterium]NLF10285.1 preprotein translocase subunit SecE [Anaerolineaceae bacterium]